MTSRLNISLPMALTLWILLLSGVSPGQSSSSFRVLETGSPAGLRSSRCIGGTVPELGAMQPRSLVRGGRPPGVIRRNAEDAILKSAALERFWGVTITGEQLQAELDRMATN